MEALWWLTRDGDATCLELYRRHYSVLRKPSQRRVAQFVGPGEKVVLRLLDKERPELVKVVAWAASNGDRSENADYIYGKRRLREIDRRIRFLTKRLENTKVIDPAEREATDQVFFGATVTLADEDGGENTYSIVGIDEADVSRGRISWISPLARALLKHREGEQITFRAPGGDQVLEIVRVEYKELP